MEKRSNESPMDFEWQTRAPGDSSSPFYQLSIAHEKESKKRSHGIFDSPTKRKIPSLREPASQPFLFSQLPQNTVNFSRGSAFTTPRKVDLDFSSGPENFSSPDVADNDETPEHPSKSDRRNSLFNFYGRFAPSPGRGEIPRLNKYSNNLVKRVQKRRRRDRELNRNLRPPSEEESSDETLAGRPQGKSQTTPQSNSDEIIGQIPFFSRLFTFLESHPHIPRILSYYAQLLFNLVIAFLILYVIIAFLLAIKHDVDIASEGQSADILAEVWSCKKNYDDNRCGDQSAKRLPAMEAICDTWEKCMQKDPSKVGRARVSAQTLAEIFNGFIEPISFKAMFFFIASIVSCVTVSNLTFSFFRNKSNNPPHMSPSYNPYIPPQSQQPHLPYTPGRHHPFEGHNSYFPPTHTNGQLQNNSQSQRQIDAGTNEHAMTPSPTKQRKFA
ncbi:hypothetical protein FQN57_002077 [Myotisia sp. PD_48]|nr:hypothetical protein FQN57_002077 [Myotisia sp. PD_48]